MVFERLLEKRWRENVPTYSLILGVFYTIVAYITSFLLFKPFLGLATILFTVILALPAVIKLFEYQYSEEEKGNQSFFNKHRTIIDFYIYFFIGAFIVFFLLAIIAPSHVFSLEDLKSKTVTGRASDAVRGPPPLPGQKQSSLTTSIFKNNAYVMVIAFLLSLFYGSGSLFLITFNGSIWGAALAKAIKLKIPAAGSFLFTYSFIGCNLGIIFFHLLPEVGAYFLAAIAGGILSNALTQEKLWTPAFKKTLKDALLLLFAALVVLYIGAIIEVNISKALFLGNTCAQSGNIVNYFWLVVIALIFIGEFLRRKSNAIHPTHVHDYVKKCRDLGFHDTIIKKKLKNEGIRNVGKLFKK